MAPLNKQDGPYLEQKENMSTLQAEPGQRAELLRLSADPESIRKEKPLRERPSGSI
jgi:hypothetical protein